MKYLCCWRGVFPGICRPYYVWPFLSYQTQYISCRSQAVRTIIFNTHSHLGVNASVLVGWIILSCGTISAFTWFFRRQEKAAVCDQLDVSKSWTFRWLMTARTAFVGFVCRLIRGNGLNGLVGITCSSFDPLFETEVVCYTFHSRCCAPAVTLERMIIWDSVASTLCNICDIIFSHCLSEIRTMSQFAVGLCLDQHRHTPSMVAYVG